MYLLKSNILAAVLICLFMTSCSKEDTVQSEPVQYNIDLSLVQQTDWEMANQILVLVNNHRASLGLNSIVVDNSYASAYAVEHTQHMIDVAQINHDNFSYRTEALKYYGAIKVAENVAFGYDTAESVVNAWLNSPGHRAVMEGDYNNSGFGIMKCDNGKTYFTQIFYKK